MPAGRTGPCIARHLRRAGTARRRTRARRRAMAASARTPRRPNGGMSPSNRSRNATQFDGDHQRKLNGDGERSLQTPAKEPQCRNVLSHGPSLRRAGPRRATLLHRLDDERLFLCRQGRTARQAQARLEEPLAPTSPPLTAAVRGRPAAGASASRRAATRCSVTRGAGECPLGSLPNASRIDRDARQPRIRAAVAGFGQEVDARVAAERVDVRAPDASPAFAPSSRGFCSCPRPSAASRLLSR